MIGINKLRIVALVIGIASISFVLGAVQGTSGSKSTQKVSAHGDLAVTYQNLDELSNDSDLVVVGKFIGNPKFDKGRVGNPLPPRKDPEALVPGNRDTKIAEQRRPSYRELTFHVTEVIQGQLPSSNPGVQKIQVGQIAVQSDATVAGVKGDRLFQPGEEYVLFLDADPLLGNEFYWVTGASQGAFVVKDNQVNSLNNQDDILSVGPKVKGESLDMFKSKVKPKQR